ncbi:MAG: hypothetical protein ACEQSR_08610 [Candidatus Methylacidiphilales bacterium]
MPINGININQKFSAENIGELIKLIDNTTSFVPQWQQDLAAKISKDLQVHTMGHFFEKSIGMFDEEPKEGKQYNVKSYEPITKSSINKGLLELSRILSSTTANITIDVNDTSKLQPLIQNYIDKWVDYGQAKDPNSKAVIIDGKLKVVEFIDIIYIDKEAIVFIDEENSNYDITKVEVPFAKGICGNKKIESFYYNYKREYIGKKTIILKNKFQIITLIKEGSSKVWDFIIEPNEIQNIPYINLGIKEVVSGVFESALQPFVPFGNLALLSHKTYRQIDSLMGYPRMTELETACEAFGCKSGKTPCTDIEKIKLNNGLPTYEDCQTCGGSGTVSAQTLWRIYKKKIQPNVSANDSGLNIPSVEYHLPPIEALTHSNDAWKELLDMAEKAIYVYQKKESGQTQTAEAKEKELQEKYNSYIKSTDSFFNGFQILLTELFGVGVVVEKPLSLAVMGEIEAFSLLQLISDSTATAPIKMAHLDGFLKRYISPSNPVVKATNILKKLDPFLFYTNVDFESLDNMGVLSAEDKVIHYFSFPLLMQMYYEDKDWFIKPNVETELNLRLAKKMAKFNDAKTNIQAALENA